MGSASYHVLCKCNKMVFGVAEAFSAPWKAAPQPPVHYCRHLFLVCIPPGQLRCPGLTSAIDVSIVLEKDTLHPSWAPGTDLSVLVTGN